MAGIDGRPDGPQAGVTEAVATQVVDHGLEEVLSRHRSKCTIWYMAEQRRGVAPTAMRAAEVQQQAPGAEPEGVGAIRRFTTGRTVSVERVVRFERDRAFSYELISGLPLVDYRADLVRA